MRILSALALAAVLAAITQAQGFTNDCSLNFKGEYRLAVKNRKAADERRRIAPSHVRSGLAELVGYWLARVFAGCAPGLQVVFTG